MESVIEQNIYSRADNDHYNANRQVVRMGYGRMAYSQGFDEIGATLDQNVNSYPGNLKDAKGSFPLILAKYEVETEQGQVQVLQQTAKILQGTRPFHVGHQYAAVGEEYVRNMLAQPLNWMQLSYQSVQREPIDYPVVQSKTLPLSVKFNPGTLTEVLKYFAMTPHSFEVLLCSLFDAVKYSAVQTVVLIKDERADYFDWIKRLIIHIYTFLPIEMRRKAGFESWLTGRKMAESIKLTFASGRYFVREGSRYYVLVGNEDYFDVSNSIIFSKDKWICMPEEGQTMRYAENHSYRRFIHPWINAALNMQNCAQVEQQLNQCWMIFDGAPDGRLASDPDQFENLINSERLRREEYFPEWNEMLQVAQRFCKGMGSYGQKLFADRLQKQRSATVLTQEKIDVLCSMLDAKQYGVDVSRTASSFLVDSFQTLNIKVRRLIDLLEMSWQKMLALNADTVSLMIRNAQIEGMDDDAWEEIGILLDLGVRVDEENLTNEARSIALERCIGALPDRFALEVCMPVLNKALKLSDDKRSRMIERILSGVMLDVDQMHNTLEMIMQECRVRPVYRGMDADEAQGKLIYNAAIALAERFMRERMLEPQVVTSLMAYFCLLFESTDINRLMVSLIQCAPLAGTDVDGIDEMMSALAECIERDGMSADLNRQALARVLDNEALSVAKRIDLHLKWHEKKTSQDDLITFLKRKTESMVLSRVDMREMLDVCAVRELAGEAAEGVAALLVCSLNAQPIDTDFIGALGQSINAVMSEEIRQACLRALFQRMRTQFPDYAKIYNDLRKLLELLDQTGYLLDEVCGLLETSTQHEFERNEESIKAFAGIAHCYAESGWERLIPIWRQLLWKIPFAEGVADALISVLVEQEVQFFERNLNELADEAHRRLMAELKNCRLTIGSMPGIFEEMYRLPQNHAMAAAAAAFSRVIVSTDEDNNRLAQLLIRNAEKYPAAEAFSVCCDRLEVLLREYGIVEELIQRYLEVCCKRQLIVRESFVRVLLRSTARTTPRWMSLMCNMAACVGLDEEFEGNPVRDAIRQIVQCNEVTYEHIAKWISVRREWETDQLCRDALAAMLGKLNEIEKDRVNACAVQLIELTGADDRELGEAAYEAYERLMPHKYYSLHTAFEALCGMKNQSRMLDIADDMISRAALDQLLDMAETISTGELYGKLLAGIAGKTKRLFECYRNNDQMIDVHFINEYGMSVLSKREDAGMKILADAKRMIGLFAWNLDAAYEPVNYLCGCIGGAEGLELNELMNMTASLTGDSYVGDGSGDGVQAEPNGQKSATDQETDEAHVRVLEIENRLFEEVSIDVPERWTLMMRTLLVRVLSDEKLIVSGSVSGDVLIHWFTALRSMGLQADGPAAIALLRFANRKKCLDKDTFELLCAILRHGTISGDMKEEAFSGVCSNIINKAEASYYSSTKREIPAKRWAMFVKPIKDNQLESQVMARCIVEMAVTKIDVFTTYWKALAQVFDQKMQDCSGSNTHFGSYAVALKMRLTATIQAIDRMAEENPRAADRIIEELKQFGYGCIAAHFFDFDWTKRFLEITCSTDVSEEYREYLIGLMQKNRKEQASISVQPEDIFDIRLRDAVKSVKESDSAVYVQYLRMRMIWIAQYVIPPVQTSNQTVKAVKALLDVKAPEDILKCWVHFCRSAAHPELRAIKQWGIEEICHRYSAAASAGAIQFKLMFSGEILEEMKKAKYYPADVMLIGILGGNAYYKGKTEKYAEYFRSLTAMLEPVSDKIPDWKVLSAGKLSMSSVHVAKVYGYAP